MVQAKKTNWKKNDFLKTDVIYIKLFSNHMCKNIKNSQKIIEDEWLFHHQSPQTQSVYIAMIFPNGVSFHIGCKRWQP